LSFFINYFFVTVENIGKGMVLCSALCNMLTGADLLFAGLTFVWAIMLGVINFENKLYVFMIIWIVLTFMISSTSVRLVVLIQACALLATIFLHLFDRCIMTTRILLRDALDNLAITRLLRNARIAAAAFAS